MRKYFSIFDFLILGVAIYIFATLDYSNLRTGDIIYMVASAIWFAMLVVRIYILHKNEDVKK